MPYWIHGTPVKQLTRELDEAEKTGTPCAPVEVRDRAYRALLEALELSPEHSPFHEAWELGYRTTSAKGDARPAKIAVRASGAKSVMDTLAIPGVRIVEREGKRSLALSHWVGCYLPVLDHEGRITALMVRREQRENKYVWLRGDKEGSATGQLPHVALAARGLREASGGLSLEAPSKIIRVTEGVKKADVASLKTPILTIGVPSAYAWQLAFGPIQLLATRGEKQADRQIIRWAYDADARTKRGVCGALLAAIDHTLILGRVPELEVWEPEAGKGIDDVLLGEGSEAIRVLRGLEMYETLVTWCSSSGCPVPPELAARVEILKCHAELEASPDRVLTPQIAQAIQAMVGRSDLDAQIEDIKRIGSDRGRKTRFEANLASAKAQAKQEAKAKKAEELADKAKAEGLPVFVRGDHVELSQALQDRVKGAVHSEGAFWHFQGTHWEELCEEELWRIVGGFAGAPVGPTTLRISASDISGAVKITERALKNPKFFSEACHGFAFRNGFVRVDRERVSLTNLSPDQRARHAYDLDYDPDARCPQFEKFLLDIFSPQISYPADAADVERARAEGLARVQYVLEFFGLSLIGEAPRLAGKALVLLGDGANGKSTLTEVIEGIFPPETVSGVAPHDWLSDQKVALLRGKLLNIVGELPSKDLEESRTYKAAITGDTAITAKNVYERPFDFKARAGQVFNANRLFASGDGTYAFFRRNVVLTMDRVFLDHEQNKGLARELIGEKAGIICMLLQAAQRAVARGHICDPPESSKATLVDWQERSDPVRLWMTRNCRPTWRVDHCGNESPTAQVQSLYRAYKEWARDDDRRGMTSATFEERLRSVLREWARHDLDLIQRAWNQANEPPFVGALRFRGFSGNPDDVAEVDERVRASASLKRFLADGHLRGKIGKDAVRRFPLVRETDIAEAELDERLHREV